MPLGYPTARREGRGTRDEVEGMVTAWKLFSRELFAMPYLFPYATHRSSLDTDVGPESEGHRETHS